MTFKGNKSIRFFVGLSLGAATCYSQALNANPPARTHVKVEGGKNMKYTSKLKKVIHLNFTMGFHHNEGKPIITKALTDLGKKYAVGGVDAFTVTSFTGTSNGTTQNSVPEFTAADITSGEVIVANNVSEFGRSNLGTVKQQAIQKAIETDGKGYLGIHGSGDNTQGGWAWYTNTLHPVTYQGHGDQTTAPVYKHLAEEKNIILDGILATKTTLATVPNEMDAGGAAVMASNVPTRKMYNEWYRFGRDISRVDPFKANTTILLKYDPKDLSTAVLANQYRRVGGNLYTYLFKVGAGMTSFFPPGHNNRETLDATDGFDGGLGDMDRYLAQLLFFLAGYDKVECDQTCMGLPIVDANNRLTGQVVETTSAGDFVLGTMNPKLILNEGKMAFSSTFDGKYEAVLADMSGRVIYRTSGIGHVNHEFRASNLKSGVYFMKVKIGDSAVQTKRYAIASTGI